MTKLRLLIFTALVSALVLVQAFSPAIQAQSCGACAAGAGAAWNYSYTTCRANGTGDLICRQLACYDQNWYVISNCSSECQGMIPTCAGT